jgi:hypothetical protein
MESAIFFFVAIDIVWATKLLFFSCVNSVISQISQLFSSIFLSQKTSQIGQISTQANRLLNVA